MRVVRRHDLPYARPAAAGDATSAVRFPQAIVDGRPTMPDLQTYRCVLKCRAGVETSLAAIPLASPSANASRASQSV